MTITEKSDIIVEIRKTILAELDDSEFKRNLDECIDSLISKIFESRAMAYQV